MRVSDITKPALLNEGPLASRDFYERYRLVNFITKIANKEPFYTVDGNQVVIPASEAELKFLNDILNYSFDSVDPKARAKNINIPAVIGGVKLSTLAKTKEFGGKVGMSAGGMDYSKANLGPTVEALKAFAIYAKLVYRDVDVITDKHVLEVGQIADRHSKEDFATNPDTGKKSTTMTSFAVYRMDVPDRNKNINDNIELKIALSTPSFKRAVNVTPADKAAWGNLQGIIKYVNNESDIGRYSRFFAGNNKRDPLHISVVGIGGAKTDISSTYTTPDGKEKPIRNLSLSVKSAGAEWYDQAPAGNEKGMSKFYNIIGLSDADAEEAIAASKFKGGGKESSEAQWNSRVKAVTKIYKYAFNQLKARIPQLNDKGEADYIHSFLNQLRKSIAGDETLIYVKFDANGTYEKLKPHLLANLASHINLDVNLTTDGRPRIYWIDSKTGKTLVFVVLLVNEPNKRLTHQFNLGKDFFSLLRQAETATTGKDPLTPPPATKQQVPTQQPAQQQAPAQQPAQQSMQGPNVTTITGFDVKSQAPEKYPEIAEQLAIIKKNAGL